MLNEVTDITFEKEVIEGSSDSVVIVDYYSNTCAPCKRLMPKLENVSEKLSSDSNKIVKINVEENFESSMRNMVRTIPTLAVYKNGEVIETLRGCSQISEEEIENLLNL